MAAPRLCKLCNGYFTLDDENFEVVSKSKRGLSVVLDKVNNVAHLLMSEKWTAARLRREQQKLETLVRPIKQLAEINEQFASVIGPGPEAPNGMAVTEFSSPSARE